MEQVAGQNNYCDTLSIFSHNKNFGWKFNLLVKQTMFPYLLSKWNEYGFVNGSMWQTVRGSHSKRPFHIVDNSLIHGHSFWVDILVISYTISCVWVSICAYLECCCLYEVSWLTYLSTKCRKAIVLYDLCSYVHLR